MAVAARMLWVGWDTVRQEVCSGLVRLGMKRSVKGQAGICRGLVRLGHIRCGSQGTAADMFWRGWVMNGQAGICKGAVGTGRMWNV
jgi:hypothetical protein